MIQVKSARGYSSINEKYAFEQGRTGMTKSVPDKAEVAVEYPDKLYIGTFERSSRFDAHLDETGISLSLHRSGAEDVRNPFVCTFDYALFAEILRELAKTVTALPATDVTHREALRDAAKTLYLALAQEGSNGKAGLTPDEEVRLLHILE